jgi:hypothetical protein
MLWPGAGATRLIRWCGRKLHMEMVLDGWGRGRGGGGLVNISKSIFDERIRLSGGSGGWEGGRGKIKERD